MNAQMLFFVCLSASLAGFGIVFIFAGVLMMACGSDRQSWPRSQTRAAMKRQTPPKSPKDFIALLNELDDTVPMGDEEAAEILREAGIDPECEFKRAMVLVDEEEKRQQKALVKQAQRAVA